MSHPHPENGLRNIWVEDTLWIEDTPEGGLAVRFGQFGRLLETSPGHLDALPALAVWKTGSGDRPPRLALEARHDGLIVTGASADWAVQAEDLSVAVIHADGLPGRKPMLYARWQPKGAAVTEPSLNLDIVLQPENGVARVFFRGLPLAGARVELLAAGSGPSELVADEAGYLNLPSLSAGLHQLVCSHTEKLPARVGGKSYGGTRHWSTLTFRCDDKARMTRRRFGALATAAAAALLFPARPRPAQAQSFDVVDGVGRTVRLAAPPRRIVLLPITAAATFIAMDGSIDRLRAIHPRSRETLAKGLLGRVFPKIADIPVTNPIASSDEGAVNVEEIAALEPDLVVQRGAPGGDAARPFEQAGLPTALLVYGTEAAARKTLEVTAAILNKPERGARFIAWRDRTLARIADQLREKSRPLKALYVTQVNDSFRATGAGTYIDQCLHIAGVRNAADGIRGAQIVSREQILLWNPDVILLPSYLDGLSPAQIETDPLLGELSAVRSNRIYKAPMGGYRWEAPNHENPLFWMWLAMLGHDGGPRFDLRTAIRDSYDWIYGYRPAEDEIDAILQFPVNGRQAGYAALGRGAAVR